jgi:polyhydroxybutyrate depolymerase
METRGDLLRREPGGHDLSNLERRELDIAGVRRTYWLARARVRLGASAPGAGEPGNSPLLIVLHGSGMSGRAIARFTGLAARAPAAGITTVFPDGWKEAWHPARPPESAPKLDDVLFLATLSAHLEAIGVAQAWPVFLAGISNGALFAEHVARHGLLPVTGLFLVAGTALEFSRSSAPTPVLRTTVTCVMGTGDPSVPYQGGPLSRRGITGLLQRRRAARHGELPGESVIAGAEETCGDWARSNGITSGPQVAELPAHPGDLTVTRKTWSGPGCRPVTLYRIDGGGHGWPGGPQFLPVRVIGPIARHLDATGILLEMAGREAGAGPGRRRLGPSGGPPWDPSGGPSSSGGYFGFDMLAMLIAGQGDRRLPG